MRTKKWYLFLLFLISNSVLSQSFGSYAGARDWVKVYENDNIDVYVLRSFVQPITNTQITRKGFSLIDMTNFKKASEDGASMASIVHMAYVDCANPGYKSNGGKIYQKHYANGFGEEIRGATWTDISKANESAIAVYKALCVN